MEQETIITDAEFAAKVAENEVLKDKLINLYCKAHMAAKQSTLNKKYTSTEDFGSHFSIMGYSSFVLEDDKKSVRHLIALSDKQSDDDGEYYKLCFNTVWVILSVEEGDELINLVTTRANKYDKTQLDMLLTQIN